MKILKPNYKWNGILSKRHRTDYIVLHHAEASKCSPEDIHKWHLNNGWSGIGYHFFVRKDGTIYEGRPLDTIGSHVQGKNSQSIGICAEGDYMTEKMPDVQKNAICELLVYLNKIYPNAKIVGHGEIGDSNCPGRNYPLAEIKLNYSNIGGLTMTQYEELKAEIEALKKRMIYNYIDDNMPEWAKEGVQYCIDNGFITGTGNGLGLDDKDLKYCTIIMRLHKAVT